MNRLSNWNKVLMCGAALLLAYGASRAAGPQPTGSDVNYSQPVSGRNSGGKNIPILVDDAGTLSVNVKGGSVTVSIPDSGFTVNQGNPGTTWPVYLSTPDGGQPYIVSVGPWTSSVNCVEMNCNPQADGGSTVLTAGQHYDAVVDFNAGAPVRFLNGSTPTSYAAGPGRYLAPGNILDYVPPSTADGGTPSIQCVTPSGTTILQFCPTSVNNR